MLITRLRNTTYEELLKNACFENVDKIFFLDIDNIQNGYNECWVLTKMDERKLKAFEIRVCCVILVHSFDEAR